MEPFKIMVFSSLCIAGVLSTDTVGTEKLGHIKPKQLFLSPENRYSSGVYDFNFLNPQQPSPSVPQYNFPQPRQPMPRYQPQFFFYGGGPGQPFLVNPGPPPNNFLFPQPGVPQSPGVIYRNAPGMPQPGGPMFVGGGGVGGFPQGIPNQKPGFVPTIEKDAEEVPTNPARIPPFKPKKPVRKPEKLETFDIPSATEADDLEGTEKPQANPKIPKMNPLKPKPGHRFFVLNGQPIFNYPFTFYQPQNINPEDLQKFAQKFPKTQPQNIPVPVIPAIPNPQVPNFQDSVLQNPHFHHPAVLDGFKPDQNRGNAIPANFDPYLYQSNQQGFPQFNPHQTGFPNLQQNIPFDYLQPGIQFNTQQAPFESPQQQQQQEPQVPPSTSQQDQKTDQKPEGSVVTSADHSVQSRSGVFKTILPLTVTPNSDQKINIRVSTKDFNLEPVNSRRNPGYLHQYSSEELENDAVIIETKYDDDEKDSEVVSTPDKQPLEPSLAQAGPGAIALAGPGGVAAAGPRATAFVGKEGMAVSSPKATAIAGPSREDIQEEDQDSKKVKQEKYVRQRFRGRYN